MVGLFKPKSKKGEQKKSASPAPASSPGAKSDQPSTQSWFPIRDINNNLLYRKDGYVVAAVRVQPVNIDLLSKNEKRRKIKQLEEVLNGVDYPYQIISIAKPVDLDGFIADLEALRNQSDSMLKMKLLMDYKNQAIAKATSGEALERQFYFLLSEKLGKRPEIDIQVVSSRAIQMTAALTGAELMSHVCSDNEQQELQFIFSHSTQAAYERAPLTREKFPAILYEEEV